MATDTVSEPNRLRLGSLEGIGVSRGMLPQASASSNPYPGYRDIIVRSQTTFGRLGQPQRSEDDSYYRNSAAVALVAINGMDDLARIRSELSNHLFSGSRLHRKLPSRLPIELQ